MTDKMDNFAARCKKLPGRLKQWDAFTQLRSARTAKNRIRKTIQDSGSLEDPPAWMPGQDILTDVKQHD